MTYSSSLNTHVFPFGSGRHVHPYDHVLNEVNIANIIKTVTDEKSYLIDYDSDSHKARFVIEGYYFETVVPNQGTVEEPNYKNIYAIANIVAIDGYRYLSGLDSDQPNTEINADEGELSQFTVKTSGYIDVNFDADPEQPYTITINNDSDSEELRLSCNNAVQFPQSATVFIDTMCVHVPKKSKVTLNLYTSTRIDAVVGNPSSSSFTGLYFDTYAKAPTRGYFLQLTDSQGSACEVSLFKVNDTSVEVRGQSLLKEIGESDNTEYKSLSVRKSIDTLAEKISEEATARTNNDNDINNKIGTEQDAPEKTTVYGYINRQDATVEQRLTDEVNDIKDVIGTAKDTSNGTVYGYINKQISNVYTKDQVYTKEEVDDNIIGVPGTPEEKDDAGNVITEAVAGTGVYENVYSKDEITAYISEVTGGESAAAVLIKLNKEIERSTNKDNSHDTSISSHDEDIRSLKRILTWKNL